MVDYIIKLGWSVRKAEEFVIKQKQRPKKQVQSKPLETSLSKLLAKKLNTRVVIHSKSKGGSIDIYYKTKDDLDRILKKLAG